MFDAFSDVVAGIASIGAVAYVLYEMDRRKKQLRDLISVLDADDAKLSRQLEEMAKTGQLVQYRGAPTA